MKRIVATVAAVLVSSLALPAFASENGLTLGLRTGFGIPLGDSTKSMALNKTFAGTVPLWIDVGYRFNPNFSAGGFFQYGLGFMEKGGCREDLSCSASVVRFGVQAAYNFEPTAVFAPWVGLGIGYEMATVSWTEQGSDLDWTWRGIEYLNLQYGADFKVTPQLSFGPFLTFSIGRYSTRTIVETSGTNSLTQSVHIPSDYQAMHQWLQVGLRGTFNL